MDFARTINPTLIKTHVKLKSWLRKSKPSTYRAVWRGGGTAAAASVDERVCRVEAKLYEVSSVGLETVLKCFWTCFQQINFKSSSQINVLPSNWVNCVSYSKPVCNCCSL